MGEEKSSASLWKGKDEKLDCHARLRQARNDKKEGNFKKTKLLQKENRSLFPLGQGNNLIVFVQSDNPRAHSISFG